MLKTREQIALELLAFEMQQRLAEGYNTLLLEQVNNVLFVAKQVAIEPNSKKELMIIQ